MSLRKSSKWIRQSLNKVLLIFSIHFSNILLAMNGCIQLKKGETVIPSSTEQKKPLYRGERSTIGFKVDLMILYDYWILCFCTAVWSDVSKRYVCVVNVEWHFLHHQHFGGRIKLYHFSPCLLTFSKIVEPWKASWLNCKTTTVLLTYQEQEQW